MHLGYFFKYYFYEKHSVSWFAVYLWNNYQNIVKYFCLTITLPMLCDFKQLNHQVNFGPISPCQRKDIWPCKTV